MKFFNDPGKPAGSRVVSQHYYTGHEKRLLYRVPLPRNNVSFGDQCGTCSQLGRIAASIESFTGYSSLEVVTTMMASILGRTCVPLSGQKVLQIQTHLINYAKRNVFVDDAKNSVISMADTTADKVDMVFEDMVSRNLIGYRVINVDIDHDDYFRAASKKVNNQWIETRWDKDYLSYISKNVGGTWQVFDANDKVIRKTRVTQMLTFLPKSGHNRCVRLNLVGISPLENMLMSTLPSISKLDVSPDLKEELCLIDRTGRLSFDILKVRSRNPHNGPSCRVHIGNDFKQNFDYFVMKSPMPNEVYMMSIHCDHIMSAHKYQLYKFREFNVSLSQVQAMGNPNLRMIYSFRSLFRAHYYSGMKTIMLSINSMLCTHLDMARLILVAQFVRGMF
jgi:hypothetical protein